MRKQFLYLGNAGFHYRGPGNIGVTAGSKGTVTVWHHPTPWYPGNQVLWEARGDSTNGLRLRFAGPANLVFESRHGSWGEGVTWSGFELPLRNFWFPITCTWDFTTPGAGQLRLYANGQEAPTRVDNATAPLVEALKLYLGGPTNLGFDPVWGCFDNLAVWDGVMTKAQHDALWGGATNWTQRQRMRRRMPQESDGQGRLTLLAGFDGSYDAVVAGGDAQGYWEVAADKYDEFCLLDDGARGRGIRHRFFFGKPRHDGTADDRVPLQAVLTPITAFGTDRYTTLTNHATHGEIAVSQVDGGNDVGQGMGWLRAWLDPHDVQRPATVRMRVNCPPATNAVGAKITLGPLSYVHGGEHGNNFGTWGTGELGAVVADAANTVSSFKTNLLSRAAGYWNGAELTFRSGTNQGTRLKVSGYDPATGIVTVSGAAAAVPAGGDRLVVDHRGRLLAAGPTPNELQSLEAWLWENYDVDKPWIELEAVYGNEGGTSFVRYDRGRTVWMDLVPSRSDDLGNNLMFGRSRSLPAPTSYKCDILLESLTIEGPGSYQVLSPQDRPWARGFELADQFLLSDTVTGMSSRVWRQENVTRRLATPTMDPNPATIKTDMQAAGTWRQQSYLHGNVEPQSSSDRVTVLLAGGDANNVWRIGYLEGQWDPVRQRVVWTEETAPTGRANPFLEAADLIPGITRDAPWAFSGSGALRVLGTPDGKWSLLVGGTEGNPDHYRTRAWHGAADRWSFDWETQWWPGNPLASGMGGVDKLGADGNGTNLWGNRDADWTVAYNPYARAAERRFLGYCRMKTILLNGDYIASNRRVLGGWTSGDLKTFNLLPYGSGLSPLGASELYGCWPRVVSDDVTALYAMAFGTNVRLWASDDDRHFQQTNSVFVPGASLQTAFTLSDQIVMYVKANGVLTMAHIGRDREVYYDLDTNQTRGVVETAILERPALGWAHLILNSAPNQGTIKVEVLDPRTDTPLAGFGAEDSLTLSGGIQETVTWGGVPLPEVTAEAIRLRFILTRAAAGDVSPALYAWKVATVDGGARPSAAGLQVEGQANPAAVRDRTPTFSWVYSDPRGKAQQAYQVIVASSPEQLAARNGDIWDTGPVVGAATASEYGGPALADETTYFWAVRVQNAEGVWSEEW